MMRKVSLRVPATSANCGPGFDTLGLACTLYNEVTYELTDRGFALEVTGEGRDQLQPFGKNLAYAAFFRLWNQLTDHCHTGLKVTMLNRIPLSRGLGSSSAAIVAGLMAANLLCDAGLDRQVLLNYAAEMEGHPDNVAPAIFGNFTVSYMDGVEAHSLVVQPARPLKFVAVVPERPLSTFLARQAIPAQIPHKDGVFNVSRASLLVGTLLSGRYEYLGAALEDRLHQPYRAHLIPGLEAAFDAGRKAGAYNVIISGAGSTLMAYADPALDCECIGAAMCAALRQQGEPCTYHLLDLDTQGVMEL